MKLFTTTKIHFSFFACLTVRECWFANHTHYIDSDTCRWQSLDDEDTLLILPDHWKNVHVED